MRVATLLLILLGAPSLVGGQQPRAASPAADASTAASVARFNGTWDVTINCPQHTDGALGYTLEFPAQVKDGVIHGQYGAEGQPSWLRLDGRIQADGSASMNAGGLTGDQKYNVDKVQKSTPYAYGVTAHFEGSRGTGKRIETRACDLTFVKR